MSQIPDNIVQVMVAASVTYSVVLVMLIHFVYKD